jgi:hypothetical protein
MLQLSTICWLVLLMMSTTLLLVKQLGGKNYTIHRVLSSEDSLLSHKLSLQMGLACSYA